MMPVKELLNKIKWDKRLDPEGYSLSYMDRILNKEVKIKYLDILRVEDSFIIVNDAMIPIHRINKVFKKGRVIWERAKKK